MPIETKVASILETAALGSRVIVDEDKFVIYDDIGDKVFEALLSSTDVGDVIIGNFVGNKGAKWDKSANIFIVRGSIYGQDMVIDDGNHNTVIGDNAFKSNTTGHDNLAIGIDVLYFNTIGYYNIAIGYGALRSNTIGSINIAIGPGALQSNTTGHGNIAIEHLALYSNTTGYNNIAIGDEALRSNTIGYYNIAIGYGALRSNTIGSINIAIGPGALQNNTTGNGNIALGKDTLISNTTGYYNIAMGYQALYSVRPTSKKISNFYDYSATVLGTVRATSVAHGLTGTVDNIGIYGTTNYNGIYTITVIDVDNFYFTDTWVSDDATGWWGKDTEGRYNIGIGYQAGYSLVTGSQNIFIGYQAGYNELGSNKLYIEPSNSTEPLIYGEFDNDYLKIFGTIEAKGRRHTITAQTTTTLTLGHHSVIVCDTNSNAIAITLPDANTVLGQRYLVFLQTRPGTNNVTVTTASGDTLDGTNNTATLDAVGDFFEFIAVSANRWLIVINNGITLSTV